MSAALVRWGFYPVTLLATLAYILAEVTGPAATLGAAYPAYLASLIGLMLLLERLLPMRRAWGMTRRSLFVRDLPMLAANGAALAATGKAVVWLASQHAGLPLARLAWPWWAQALLALLVSDLLWYGVHRLSHEGRGRTGQWLWRLHALHHLPGEVYVFMHAVGHPLNSAIVRVILMLPGVLLGLSPQALFAAMVFNGFQGLVSHFNVDARAGWFNRLFMGTELHRFHHSADRAEAGNYAAVFSIWDQLFGSYRLPAPAPDHLGVADRAAYPADREWLKLLLFPFARQPR